VLLLAPLPGLFDRARIVNEKCAHGAYNEFVTKDFNNKKCVGDLSQIIKNEFESYNFLSGGSVQYLKFNYTQLCSGTAKSNLIKAKTRTYLAMKNNCHVNREPL
jgi:hypothetical protein